MDDPQDEEISEADKAVSYFFPFPECLPTFIAKFCPPIHCLSQPFQTNGVKVLLLSDTTAKLTVTPSLCIRAFIRAILVQQCFLGALPQRSRRVVSNSNTPGSLSPLSVSDLLTRMRNQPVHVSIPRTCQQP